MLDMRKSASVARPSWSQRILSSYYFLFFKWLTLIRSNFSSRICRHHRSNFDLDRPINTHREKDQSTSGSDFWLHFSFLSSIISFRHSQNTLACSSIQSRHSTFFAAVFSFSFNSRLSIDTGCPLFPTLLLSLSLSLSLSPSLSLLAPSFGLAEAVRASNLDGVEEESGASKKESVKEQKSRLCMRPTALNQRPLSISFRPCACIHHHHSPSAFFSPPSSSTPIIIIIVKHSLKHLRSGFFFFRRPNSTLFALVPLSLLFSLSFSLLRLRSLVPLFFGVTRPLPFLLLFLAGVSCHQQRLVFFFFSFSLGLSLSLSVHPAASARTTTNNTNRNSGPSGLPVAFLFLQVYVSSLSFVIYSSPVCI